MTTPSDCEIVLTREFDSPRERVFAAFTRPDLLKRWFGPRAWSLAVCEIDARVGGAFRFLMRDPGGIEMAMRGVYREIVPGERLVQLERFDGDSEESTVTNEFTEAEGRTTLTVTVLYPSREMRDLVLHSGMEQGAAESYQRLAELLALPE